MRLYQKLAINVLCNILRRAKYSTNHAMPHVFVVASIAMQEQRHIVEMFSQTLAVLCLSLHVYRSSGLTFKPAFAGIHSQVCSL